MLLAWGSASSSRCRDEETASAVTTPQPPAVVITTIRRGKDADYVFLIPRDPEGTVEVGELSGIIHGPTGSTIGGTEVVVLRREHNTGSSALS